MSYFGNKRSNEVFRFIEQTIDLALENVKSGSGGPYGALIVKDGRVISLAGNQVTIKNDPTAHAEIIAIRKACTALGDFQLHDCVLYCNCEPCPMCLGAIYWARLDRVYFSSTRKDAAKAGFDDCFIYSEISAKPEKRKIPMHQLEHARSSQPFTAWKDLTERIDY